ncbi:precorrin-6B C5,15-methyltransferase / cobalt-precorrin-6B C5,C15-methyltransferase [Cytobacillus horneckiae]|uniref:Bifunctional cobalt-precorrin-7 (C(5))-methyltransferase/cobalt-precorrin-6B (C(15))-methyltransferase n=1 Tax=Cytobacillus horneckiae TaxID=549687 RepID=A0A2N0ZIU8_9BACI|nr:bifunctional cobalt-precorrin-7 (C(5))-methyltransferase/cobalt-precorrin-6B (C(15))-methyltransferase [Cytobacillus horneckiae]MBN6886724.1 bifunctional cobalt-precorrin-7 (C(5))-methyltransferase/cobalt-precorrin-6B (C(15))-methyltransferase [Cytobacillus horneckiae]MCM3177804.1 bifunctional cobalt-precorrin-7 (C(5))-methyltransferase/cobalt-precorrin-6B (C(15))-methyltransferase [Cytobacillus horneckiae]MEC1157390.1 bifunctional cobalt-precorrin-7 (C(5))-methyltransferase/cobalt-precorrin-
MKMIGIGDNGVEGLLPQYIEWIDECDLLVGGERHLDFFPLFKKEKKAIKGGLSALTAEIQQETRNVVILVSGDPLFYGLGGVLAKKLSLEIYPYTSSVQLAFSKMQESWQDAYIVSLHGRSINGFAQKIDGRKKIAILTDETNTPQAIAKYLRKFSMTEYDAFVAENLQGENERCRFFALAEMEQASFSPLNVVILKQREAVERSSIGIPDNAFIQRKPDKGLITKKEIRTLCLQELELKENSIVWDIGTCTGSVAIEAAKIAREGAVFAIEKNEKDLENCLENQLIHRTDFVAVQGKAPERLDEFPDPHAIFIGGNGGNMEHLLQTCVFRLQPNGRLVMNIATIENLAEAQQHLKSLGCDVSIIQVQISKSKPILNLTRFQPLNPIFIVTAKKGIEK